MVFPRVILRIRTNADVNLWRSGALKTFISGQVIVGVLFTCSPSQPRGSKVQHSDFWVWCVAHQAESTWSVLRAAPSCLPELGRWARASRVWRSPCNHSWCPQSDETHLLLVPILHLLLISNRIPHNFTNNKPRLELLQKNGSFCGF